MARVPRWLRSPRWLALFAGAVLVLAFPDPNLEFLAWFGLVPGLLLIIRAQTAREGAIRAWWLGAGYLIAALYWMAPEVGPGVVLVAAVFGILWIPFGVAAWSLLRPSGPGGSVSWQRALAALVVLPSCWLLTEWLRSWQALGGPWAVFGASQWQHPAILALAAVGGVWLISFALVFSNVAIMLILGAVVPALSGRTRLSVAGVSSAGVSFAGVSLAGVSFAGFVVGVVAVVAAVGSGPLAFALTAPFPTVRQATIAMVQPGMIVDSQSEASLMLTTELSHGGSLAGAHPDLIVWGESSIPDSLFLARYHGLLTQIEALSRQDGAEILVNQDTTPPGNGHEKWAVLVSPSGIKGYYIKTRLVPFGEYIPFRQQLGWLTSISKAASSNMVPGPGAHLLQATDPSGRPLPIGVLICFESAFPDMARVDADMGAQLIVYQSSTSTFQGTWGPDQHASLGAVRAAETGRPVVQAALTGDSVAFDARGRQLASMGQSQHGVMTVRLGLPAGSDRTLYDQWGDYLPWTAVGVVVLAAMLMFARRCGILGKRAGAGDGHAAQCVAGQSVPSS
jgi:apolipoprotein N-acyltransferase